MCGLVGIINREKTKLNSDKLIKVFTQSLYCGALRGVHGTGILAVTAAAKAVYYKKALPSADFIELTKAKEIINGNNEFLCGHNRFATQGGHTAENAHPFYHGNVVMFHNGTLNTWKWMVKNKAFTVDSECLAYALSQEEDKVSLLEKIDGAFSLVWYDSLHKTLNFARNKERPMFFGVIKDSESLIYASEAKMIEWLAGRNGIELMDVLPTEVGKWIKIPLDKSEKSVITPFTPKEEESWKHYYQGYLPKKTSGKILTKPEFKFQYLLNRKEVLVDVKAWEAYSEVSAPNRWGKLICDFEDNKSVIAVSSISENDSKNYTGKKILVKVTSVLDDIRVFSTLIRIADDEDLALEKLLEETASKKVVSNVIPLRTTTCCNCNDEILPSELPLAAIDEEGSLICVDCSTSFKYQAL